jgi:hypothetical protein
LTVHHFTRLVHVAQLEFFTKECSAKVTLNSNPFVSIYFFVSSLTVTYRLQNILEANCWFISTSVILKFFKNESYICLLPVFPNDILTLSLSNYVILSYVIKCLMIILQITFLELFIFVSFSTYQFIIFLLSRSDVVSVSNRLVSIYFFVSSLTVTYRLQNILEANCWFINTSVILKFFRNESYIRLLPVFPNDILTLSLSNYVILSYVIKCLMIILQITLLELLIFVSSSTYQFIIFLLSWSDGVSVGLWQPTHFLVVCRQV